MSEPFHLNNIINGICCILSCFIITVQNEQYRFLKSDQTTLDGVQISGKLARSTLECVTICLHHEKCSTMAIAYKGIGQLHHCFAFEKATYNNQLNNHIIFNQSEFMVYQKMESLQCPPAFTKVGNGCYFLDRWSTQSWNDARTGCTAMADGSDLADFHDVTVRMTYLRGN